MKNKNNYKQCLVVGLTVIFIAVYFCGCIENNNSNEEAALSKFIGTWTGNLVSVFKGRTANITELTFIENTVDVTMISDRGIQIMTYIYSVEGNKLVLEANFDNEKPIDEEESSEDVQLSNGELPSISITFVYSFNEEYDALYVDGSEFIKSN
jgi:hypothetical protein